ncbi:hypothetical protein ACHAP8_010313 [Fusarium lateritium]
MGVVAIAGGTGDLGRTITEHLAACGKHTVFILSRKKANSPVYGAEILTIDYSDPSAIAASLDAKAVDTVISVLGDTGAEAQLKLIAGASKASSTKRFIPSEFAAYTPPDAPENEYTAGIIRAVGALKDSDLQYTRFANGIFMDYFGIPDIPSTLSPFIWGVDIAHRRAAIPGSGTDIMAMTYSKDVARFMERSDASFNEILALAQECTSDGFDVTYDDTEKLNKNDATLLDDSSYGGMDPQVMMSMVGLQLIEGGLALPKEGRLNDRYPDIKPMTIAELIAKAWKKK